MAKEIRIDIRENRLLEMDSMLLNILLKDNSSGERIIWATDDYTQYNEAFTKDRQITVFSITGKNGNIIKPRIEKTKQEQLSRVRDKAEVFTPSWICNKQNNLVDNAWFGIENVFNVTAEPLTGGVAVFIGLISLMRIKEGSVHTAVEGFHCIFVSFNFNF